MNRDEYLVNPSPYAKCGFDLPQTKIPENGIRAIRAAVETRIRLRAEINEKYSNAALAKKFNVHPRTIEKIISFETGRHVL